MRIGFKYQIKANISKD